MAPSWVYVMANWLYLVFLWPTVSKVSCFVSEQYSKHIVTVISLPHETHESEGGGVIECWVTIRTVTLCTHESRRIFIDF